ncbi:hypothetical protein IFT73_04510 [Aeromicrobium sp. CFBP 8757]|uniref:hypothetical protein n=1 Tax=Aeromicrobium sp. CFBP 8757 TaxID=2775288 RepID=UPI00177D9BBD|nr:hypothetical protein [Aeromicrobium sp. CFBP 8757]MBD8606108.1 hypothetical protein [Aeromicrobium sp. CFBP 8757]
MLTRSATRRSAVVLMMALVAMLLVATGGSARATQQARTSAGTGHLTAAPQHGRQAASVPPASHDHGHLHLDLATTAPDDVASPAAVVDEPVATHDASHVAAATVTVEGRAPPAP